MAGRWQQVCRLKDVPLAGEGTLVVPRGLAWQELPGVALCRTGEHSVTAVLESTALTPADGAARPYSVLVEEGRVLLDLDELRAPASRAEAALAGTLGVATRVPAPG